VATDFWQYLKEIDNWNMESTKMTSENHTILNDIIRSIHALEDDLRAYERKYHLLSDTFYAVYQQGEEPGEEAWVLDWASWAGAYQSWLTLREHYQQFIQRMRQNAHSLTGLVEAVA